jgi:hypothetical protein
VATGCGESRHERQMRVLVVRVALEDPEQVTTNASVSTVSARRFEQSRAIGKKRTPQPVLIMSALRSGIG